MKRFILKRQTDRGSARNAKSQELFKCVQASKGRRERMRNIKCFCFLSLGLSQVMSKEMSFQLLLGDWQGSSFLDRGGKIIPPARSGERECSGEWLWCSVYGVEEGSKNRYLGYPSDQLMCFGCLPSPGHPERSTSEIKLKPAKWNPSDAQWWEGGQDDLMIDRVKSGR